MRSEKGRSAVVVVLLVVLALVAAAIWFAMQGGSPADEPAPVAQGSVAKDAAPHTEQRKRARAVRTWVEIGAGEVTGILLTYGTEKPLAGHTVTLTAGAPGPDRTVETKSGADGAFRFKGVPNFDDWTLRVDVAEPLADLEQAGVTVVENKVTDLGVLYVTPAFTVPGIVLDEQGAPVEGAEVRALRARSGGSQMDILRLIRELPRDTPAVDRATTGADGRFRLAKTSPGAYDFKVVKAGRQVLVEKQVIVTPDAEKRELRFVMSKGFQLDGRVVRKGPGTVAGLPVVAFRQPRGEFDFLVLDRTYAVTTDEGKFHLDGLGGGEYVVSVTPEGEPYAIKDDVSLPGTTWVEVVIEGDSSLEGKVTGTGGVAVPGAQVYIGNFDRKPIVVGSTRADGEGRYRIDGLRAGKMQLFLVQAEGYATWPGDVMAMLQGSDAGLVLKSGPNVKDVSLEPGGTIRGTVSSKDDEKPLEGVRVELGSPLAMFGGTRGATTDGAGKFEIAAVPVGTSVLIVSKDGWFQPGLDPMSLAMAFQGGGKKTADTGKGYVVSISEPGEVVERKLVLAHGSTVTGQVTSPDGLPVSGARVELKSEGDNGFLDGLSVLFGVSDPRLTDAEGKFEMPGPRPGTKARVVATSRGFLEGRSEPVAAGVGQRVEGVAVRMRVGARLEGRVTGEGGKPLEGALVRWLKTEGLQEWEVGWRMQAQKPSVTDADGRYAAENVEPGRVTVQVEEGRHLPTTVKDVVTGEGKAAVVDAKLSMGATIAGRVLATDGKACAGATVVLDRRTEEGEPQPTWNGRGNNRTTADADGKFRAEGLRPGRYDARAELRGFAPSEKVAVVADGGPVTLRLQSALRIGGMVRVAGAPVARVDIDVMRRARGDGAPGGAAATSGAAAENWEQAASMESDREGRFLFEDLPAGSYRLNFGPAGWGEGRANVLKKTVEDVAAGNESLVVDLEGGLAISGTVTLEDGTPAANGWINANPVTADGMPVAGGANAWGSFDGGKFELVGLAPGAYDLQVNVQGSGNKRVRAEAGKRDLAIVIGAGCKITGRVVLEDGAAAPNVWVQAHNDQGGQGAVTDVDGRYTIAGLEPGTYRIDAQVMGGQNGAHGVIEQVVTRANDVVEAPQLTVHPQPAGEVK